MKQIILENIEMFIGSNPTNNKYKMLFLMAFLNLFFVKFTSPCIITTTTITFHPSIHSSNKNVIKSSAQLSSVRGNAAV